jgi:hypothetical protein
VGARAEAEVRALSLEMAEMLPASSIEARAVPIVARRRGRAGPLR